MTQPGDKAVLVDQKKLRCFVSTVCSEYMTPAQVEQVVSDMNDAVYSEGSFHVPGVPQQVDYILSNLEPK